MDYEILSFTFLMCDFCSTIYIFTQNIHKRKLGVLIKLLLMNKKNLNSFTLKIQILNIHPILIQIVKFK
jgi:hypothetical protein